MKMVTRLGEEASELISFTTLYVLDPGSRNVSIIYLMYAIMLSD
jgi:hypothetical protein